MKKRYITLFALSLLFFTACSDDFLDVDQKESVSTDDLELYNNDKGAATFTTAIYNKFLNYDMSSFPWIGIASITSDDADKGSSPGDTGGDKDVLDALTFNASNPSFLDVFRANYDGINRCNQALNIIPKLDKANPQLRERLMGEAKFLRAYMYFTLVKCFGGVPIVDRLPNPSSDEDRKMLLERKTKEEVYALIEKDLKEAIPVLVDKSAYPANEKARASKGAAYALLAKVSLYQQKWQQVVDNCNAVTGYSLSPDFAKMFRVEGENDNESIFEIQSTGLAPAIGIQQYSQVQGARGAGGWGWGFNTPSESLVNAFEPGDVRKAATIIFRGTTLYDGRVVPNTVENERYNYKVFSSLYTGADITDANMKLMRYAEVLLMKAEALNELGQTSAAIPLLNQVRNRAGLANTTALSQSEVKLAIWKERRVEMAMENDRYFDLVRTGQAVSAFAAVGKTFVTGKHEVFPIPQNFIIQQGDFAQQNPNY